MIDHDPDFMTDLQRMLRRGGCRLAFLTGGLGICLTFLLAFAAPVRADLLVKPSDRVLVAAEVPLIPGMASVDIAAYFLMCQPVDGLEVISASAGQDNVEPFMRRIATDIGPWTPNVALVSHGMGDGHAGRDDQNFTHYHPLYLGQTVDELRKIGVRTIILGTTSCVDSTLFQNAVPAKTWNDNLALFRDLDHDIATKEDVAFADIFSPTLDVMTKAKASYGDAYVFADQGRYLQRNAQLVMAWVFLKALGVPGDIGTITVDMTENTATGTPGQKIISDQEGIVQIESTRYPFCFSGDPKTADATSGIISFFPFNDDLNRYLLVVHGLTSAKAKVTWGAESRELAVADLEKGVNLAAVFAAHTPFDATFLHVQDILWQQQLKQFVFTDSVIQHLPDLKKMASDTLLDQLVAGIHDQDQKNGAMAAALFVPIQHTLKIEALP